MPTIENIGAYRVQLHTGREGGTPHVHVCYGGKEVVVNMLRLRPYGKKHFRVPGNVMKYLDRHQVRILAMWEKYHGRR